MDDLFNNSLWQVLIPLFAIIVMVIIYIAQRKKKKLSYEITSSTQLVGVKKGIEEKVEIFYDGVEVKNVHLLLIRFRNSGNQPITSDDFERPLSIKLNDKSTILTDEIIDEEPANLGAEIDVNETTLSVYPLLLNPKDSFTVKALVSDYEDHPDIESRINGVKSISEYRERDYLIIAILFSQVIMLTYLSFFSTGTSKVLIIALALIFLTLSIATVSFLMSRFGKDK